MKKSAIVLFFAAFLSVSAFAQSVQEGVNHLYAKRYQSAKAVFDKLIASNPNNIDAIYWLGQTHIAQKNTAAAKSVYDKALATNGNAPLLIAGGGNVDLIEGKQADSRSRFETAINTSKGKKGADPMVLNAVGRAIVNAHTEKKKQDLEYAISKLNESAQIAPNNAETYVILGNAYRYQAKGGDAVSAYTKATQLNPSLALAPYRTALLYKTQVSYRDPNNWGAVLDNLNAAVKADPRFAPAIEELYFYNLFAKKDFAAAQTLSQQFNSSADPSPDNRYLEMQVPIVQQDWAKVIEIGKQIVTETSNNPSAIVYRSMSRASMGLKDTATACTYINQFFAKAAEDDILSSDYILRAQACGRGNWEVMWNEINNAVKSDTSLPRQIRLINETLDDAKATGSQLFLAQLRMLSFQLRSAKGAPTSPTELISYMTIPFYLGGAYQKSDSIATEYIRLAPDSIYGHYWRGRAKAAIDTGDAQQGTYVADYDKALEIALTDTVRYRSLGPTAARTLAIYYANQKKDYAKAMEYVQKGKKFDAADPNLLNIEKLLQQYLNRKTTPPTQKTNTQSNQGKTDTKTKTPAKKKT